MAKIQQSATLQNIDDIFFKVPSLCPHFFCGFVLIIYRSFWTLISQKLVDSYYLRFLPYMSPSYKQQSLVPWIYATTLSLSCWYPQLPTSCLDCSQFLRLDLFYELDLPCSWRPDRRFHLNTENFHTVIVLGSPRLLSSGIVLFQCNVLPSWNSLLSIRIWFRPSKLSTNCCSSSLLSAACHAYIIGKTEIRDATSRDVC